MGINKLKFIDLFAGLGGFHLALSNLGHECVFASELSSELRDLYEKNFALTPHGDIRDEWVHVPAHDVLCAGFPCQPFSKAGGQLGFECPSSGDMFDYVLKIIDQHNPKYLLLENVPNIFKHNKGATWKRIVTELEARNYGVDSHMVSPDMFGVPQKRKRAIIVGQKKGLSTFAWPTPTHTEKDISVKSILDIHPEESEYLSENAQAYFDVWQEFLNIIPKSDPLPSFPIWSMEFGADYPLTGLTPAQLSGRALACYKGAFGQPLKGLSQAQKILTLPPYARQELGGFPSWKVAFIQSNRDFYKKHQDILSKWLPAVQSFAPSFQKLEWNWKDGPRSIERAIVQFRASGIRVKKPYTAPSLVALTTSQVPVVGWERRFMTMRECARLQSMGALKYLPESKTGTYKALGNAVNVKVIQNVANNLIGEYVADSTSSALNWRKTRRATVVAAANF